MEEKCKNCYYLREVKTFSSQILRSTVPFNQDSFNEHLRQAIKTARDDDKQQNLSDEGKRILLSALKSIRKKAVAAIESHQDLSRKAIVNMVSLALNAYGKREGK